MVLIVLFSLYFGLSYGDEVRPWKDLQTSEETQETKIYCNYSLSNNAYTEYLFWYQQIPGRNPRYILHRYKASGGSEELRSEESDRRFIGHLNTSTKMTYLSISNTQLSDSALYYCALGTGTGLNKLIFGTGTKLIVEPEEKSKTAAFVLGSDEDNKEDKARACLITDFSSHNISVNFGGVDVPVVPSVIKGDKQYSVVAFLPESKDRSNFNCNAFVNGNTTEGDNNDIENVCESDSAYVFESDEKLNSLSLMVLGLRVIFLKSIVFNVLMTVRAWMS